MTNKKEPTYKEIWDTLSKVDVSEYVEEKMNLSYLSWSRAWWLLQQHYPEAIYSFSQPEKFDDGTQEVGCLITIGECSRFATLPVMDYKNKAVISPDARQINDNKQRCFVKAIAMFGLGIDLYRGMSDDLPDEEKDKASEDKPKPKKTTEDVTAEVIELEVKETEEYSEAWADVFVEGQGKIIEAMTTIEDLRGFYKANMEKIAILGERYHEKRDELDKIFKARSKLLEDKSNG
jgi:hypothetical protein